MDKFNEVIYRNRPADKEDLELMKKIIANNLSKGIIVPISVFPFYQLNYDFQSNAYIDASAYRISIDLLNDIQEICDLTGDDMDRCVVCYINSVTLQEYDKSQRKTERDIFQNIATVQSYDEESHDALRGEDYISISLFSDLLGCQTGITALLINFKSRKAYNLKIKDIHDVHSYLFGIEDTDNDESQTENHNICLTGFYSITDNGELIDFTADEITSPADLTLYFKKEVD